MENNSVVEKIISGGQTGADRAALDFAIENGIPHGGWCPKGRLTEEGPLAKKYRLSETKTEDYNERTLQNILDSDATLIFCHGELSGGSLYTLILALKYERPVLVVDLGGSVLPKEVKNWIGKHHIKILNIAGPRASKNPLIFQDVKSYLKELIREWRGAG